MIVDRIPYFRQWKLQPDKVATKEQMWRCTKAVLFSHFTIELPQVRLSFSSLGFLFLFLFGAERYPQIWGFHPLAEYFGLATHQVPFPSWKLMAAQIALFFVFEDMFHYFAHRALHYGEWG